MEKVLELVFLFFFEGFQNLEMGKDILGEFWENKGL